HKWLGIPPEGQPPTHYELLGIMPTERDSDVINAATVRQSAYIRNFQAGKHAGDATRILNEISAASVCLLDPAKRAAYDAKLKTKNPRVAPTPPVQVRPGAAQTTSAPRLGTPPTGRVPAMPGGIVPPSLVNVQNPLGISLEQAAALAAIVGQQAETE